MKKVTKLLNIVCLTGKVFSSHSAFWGHRYKYKETRWTNIPVSSLNLSISQSLSLYLYISISLYLYISKSLYLYLSISLSQYHYICISISLYLYIYISISVEACKLLTIPLVVTEQYPKGLGHTVQTLGLKVIVNRPCVARAVLQTAL